MNSLRYISDAQGRHTAVVIPVEEWNKVASKYKELKELEKLLRKPSDFLVTLSAEQGERLEKQVAQSRSEWNRNI